MNRPEPSLFERHPTATLAFIWLLFTVVFFGLAEVALKHFSGLGRPVLFFKHPSFGYRLQPNQETRRFGGAHFKINNLGLRANAKWDAGTDDKILFLGDSVTYGGNHISNEALFSEAAVKNLPNVQSGNAGIPNWGVENVYGLVVQEAFLPARIYVSTFIEDDFYRGLTLGENRPWIKYKSPYFALQELAEFLWHRFWRRSREINRREREREPDNVRAERAVTKLKAMDELLKVKGHHHLILISPTRDQVLNRTQKDLAVQSLLDAHEVEVVYLLDKLSVISASEDEKKSWYQDEAHLTLKGHRVWGDLIHEELVHKVPELDPSFPAPRGAAVP